MVMKLTEENTHETSRELVLTVTANFTAEPVGDSLRFWIPRMSLGTQRLQFSGYNQVLQELMAPNSVLASNVPGVNFLLIRLEDWARDQQESLRAETIVAVVREFGAAFTAFAQRAKRPTVLVMCPASRNACANLKMARALPSLESEVCRVAAGLRGVSLITSEDLVALYPVGVVDDPEADRVGHIPFTRNYWAAMGTMLARKARALLYPPYKVIVVDADNTLWGGVVGEVGADQVQLNEQWLVLQEFLRARKSQGMLLTLVSKNHEAEVADVFRRTDMVLRREDFVSWKINWEPKSRNIMSLAKELDLSLDSFIFLDDNPIECAEVAANCPGVTTLLLPSDMQQIPDFLRHIWAFDLGSTTAVDQKRTELYRQQTERFQFRYAAPTFREFIEGLALQVDIAPPSPADHDRAAQLSQRTTQFNTSGVRRTSSELAALLQSGERSALQVRARDRFGDYGEVGLAVFFAGENALHLESLLMSCRALGKGVEYRFLAALGREAQIRGMSDVVIQFKPTDRNRPAEKFLQSIGAHLRDDGFFQMSANTAATVTFAPESSMRPEDFAEKVETPSFTPLRPDFLEIATQLNTVEAIVQRVSHHYRRERPQLQHELVQPRFASEARLVKIWEQVLHVYPVGVTDSFLNLGGKSLQAVSITSHIAREFGVRIPLSVMLSNPTVVELNEHISQAHQLGEVAALPKAREPVLSPAQERLWFLDQFIPNRAAYNIPLAWRMRGILHLDALEAALSRVLTKHDTLRSTFTASESRSALKIVGTPMVSLRRVHATSEADALSLANEEAREPFDLTEGPLLRCLVISFAPDHHVLVLTVHHIISDGWSMGILMHDLGDSYSAMIAGREPTWAPPEVSYVDYAAWQRTRLATGDFQIGLDYWMNELHGAPTLLELPTDKSRPAVMAYLGSVVTGQVSSVSRSAIENLAQRESCTPFMVILAAFQTLLNRYSRQEDIVVGVPVAGRTHIAVEELVGCFVNTLAIRVQIDSAATFLEHLQMVRKKVLDALTHQDLPFELLVRELGLERDLSCSPLFQVMLVLQDTPYTEFTPTGLTVTSVPVHNGGAKCDLVLEVTPIADGYRMVLEFNASLFLPETAERLLRHFTRLLEQACAAPETLLASLSMMDVSEVRQMLSFINADDVSFSEYPEA